MLEGLFKESAPERSQIAAPSVFQNRTQEQSVSTFSLHVGDVSFRNAEQALLTRNALPSSAELRTEEFTAAFDYGDPAPAANEPVSLAQEQSRHPVLPETNLLRLSFRTATEGREQNQPLHLVVLLDTSGSMERPDRSEATLRAIEALEQKISEEDRITVVSFDRATQLVEDRVPGPQGVRALRALHQTTGESGTNLEDGLKTVRDISMQRQIPGASNRVLLITDGIANLGATVPESLGQVVADLRQNGVSTDIVLAGVPDGGDAVLRTLARKGDGRYFSIEGGGADVGEFARQLAGAFRPAARNVKLQVRFNPDRVEAWSLLGFEDHLLAEEDFRDDSVLAADLAAAEQATALYQVRIAPEGTGELGMVSVRFEETATGEIVERRWVIPYDAGVPPLDRAAPSMQLAAAATLFGEFLRGTPEGQLIPVEELEEISRELQNQLPATPRVETLHQMIQQTQQLKSP